MSSGAHPTVISERAGSGTRWVDQPGMPFNGSCTCQLGLRECRSLGAGGDILCVLQDQRCNDLGAIYCAAKKTNLSTWISRGNHGRFGSKAAPEFSNSLGAHFPMAPVQPGWLCNRAAQTHRPDLHADLWLILSLRKQPTKRSRPHRSIHPAIDRMPVTTQLR